MNTVKSEMGIMGESTNYKITAIVILFSIFMIWVSGTAVELNDRDITFAIEDRLDKDQHVASHMIDVKTVDGIVSLSGNVNSILARHRAAVVASTIRGVRSVVNNIRVTPVSRSDTQIKTDIEQALLLDPATEAYEVNVSVNDGEVELTGTVESWQEKRLAGYKAKGVTGVTKIRNNVDIDYEEKRADIDISEDIEKRLQYDVWVNDSLINIEVNDGNVILSGKVGSYDEIDRARIASWVLGVEDVDVSNLEVDLTLGSEMRRQKRLVEVSDREIEANIRDGFNYDPHVVADDIVIQVDNGIVRLGGVAKSLRAKNAAEEDASNTTGVWRVENHIRVRPASVPKDEDLERYILEALARDPYLITSDIDVNAEFGLVNLSGEVKTDFEKSRAEEIASAVEGVVAVENDLVFKHRWIPKPDHEVKQSVEYQIYWSPFVNLDDITVEADGGVVTLDGTVKTRWEKRKAETLALMAGAKSVINEIELEDAAQSRLTSPD